MKLDHLLNRSCAIIAIFLLFPAAPLAVAQTAPSVDSDAIKKIREEGLNHSQAMQTLSYLTDVIGPRLTGSPNLKRANEWTRKTMEKWGLENAHLEPWGPFGRGWSLKRFSIQIVEPQTIILIAYPKAWTPGFEEPFTAPVVWVDAKNESDLKKYEGKLKGAVVLAGPVRPVQARFEPLAARVGDSDLLGLADSSPGQTSPPGQARAANAAERSAQFANTPIGQRLMRGGPTSQPTSGPFGRRGGRGGAALFTGRILAFAAKEGAALIIDPSLQGDGGTVFVASASVPGQNNFGGGGRGGPRVYSVDCPPIPAQVAMAVEDYNRLVRMTQQGENLKMTVDLQVQYHTSDLMAYNTIAEIPGTDPELKDQLVMVGGHMDSWQAGTGATDNGVGVVAAMEAVRILEACNLKPRRTIRIALWTGEEEGLLGSRAYVTQHFGTNPNASAFGGGRGGRRGRGGRGTTATEPTASSPTTRPSRGLVKGPEYEKLSVYYNLDNGTGKIRGVYMQANEAARPYFRKWLDPFVDLGATTLTASNTGSTDHISFDNIGLPGFQFIQDPIEYFSRTHHSSADVFDRIQEDDLKQAATIMAAFLYNSAQMDDRFPRKPMR